MKGVITLARQNIQLDDSTEELLHDLFNTNENHQRLMLHYQKIANLYKDVIKQSPYDKPPIEIFCGLVSDTFIQNMTYLFYGLKSSVLFNVTVSEEEGYSYREIAKNLTDLMQHYENELERVEDIEMIRKQYAKQMKELRSIGAI
jgi:hypothetical protein